MAATTRLVLGIDTADRFGSIALAEGGSARAWESLHPREHSSGLSSAAERILARRHLTWRDLTGIAVSSGPGSFTGLRIGLAWAKGVCMGLGLKLALVSAHEANAWIHRREGGLIATVLPGERDQAQAALWSGGEGLKLLWGPETRPETDVGLALQGPVARARAHGAAGEVPGGPGVIPGAGIKPEALEGLRSAGFRLLAPSGTPTAAAVAELGDRNLLAGREEDLALAAPSYGRAPNARRPSP